MSEKIVIIGGGAAGPKTAAKLRRERKDLKIDLYTQEDIISYSACGLPYFIENIIQKHLFYVRLKISKSKILIFI